MIYRILAAMAATLLLTGCFLSPGKFVSEVVINKSGNFTFTYKGEILVLGLSGLMDAGRQASEANFVATCYDDDTGEERACTLEEAEEQLAAEKADNAQMEASFKSLLGGLDPNDPEVIDRFIERVERQKGWNSLVHKGDGIFDVDFSITAPLSHDFQFPVIEQVASLSSFVSILVRKDNKVRVSAPGFALDDTASGLGAFGSLAALGGGAIPGSNGDAFPKFVTPDGVFTIRTDGEILTNNTVEGPVALGEGQRQLSWTVNAATNNPPEALIGLE